MNVNYELLEVSRILQMTPATILTWTKQYNIPFTTSVKGSNIYNEEALGMLKKLKENYNKKTEVKQVSMNEIDNKLQKLLEKVSLLEDRLNQKADEVVSYQVLQHRADIETIATKVSQIETRLDRYDSMANKANNQGLKVLEYEKESDEKVLNILRLS